jgi:hypothetical protein
MLIAVGPALSAGKPIRVMIIGGQNNHDWGKSTPYMKKILDEGKQRATASV